MGRTEERNGFLFRRYEKKNGFIFENWNGLWNDIKGVRRDGKE